MGERLNIPKVASEDMVDWVDRLFNAAWCKEKTFKKGDRRYNSLDT